MKRALLALLVIGCKGTIIGEVIDPSSQLPNGTTPSSMPEPTMPTSSTARCEGVAMARSYHSLTGEALEASRVDSAVTLDTRRPRTWENITAYGDDLNQQFGYYLASNGALNFATVPVRPEYWRADAQLGALELYSHFRVGYIVCTRMLSEPNGSAAFTTDDLKSAPTAESGARVCHRLMRQLWKEEPSAAQVGACATFATDETTTLMTVNERWALVCAALLSSTGSTTQ